MYTDRLWPPGTEVQTEQRDGWQRAGARALSLRKLKESRVAIIILNTGSVHTKQRVTTVPAKTGGAAVGHSCHAVSQWQAGSVVLPSRAFRTDGLNLSHQRVGAGTKSSCSALVPWVLSCECGRVALSVSSAHEPF